MATDLYQARSVAHLVEHLRQKVEISDRDAISIGGEIAEALLRFEDTWDADVEMQRDRFKGVIDGVHRALSSIVAADPSYGLPFQSDSDFWAWLEFPELDDIEGQDAYFEAASDWRITSLWRVRADALREIDALADFDAAVRANRPAYIKTSSRLAPSIQHLIEDLCRAWYDRVGELGMTNEAKPSTPLLRFLDACLEQAMGSEHPDKGEVRNFVRPYLKPVLVKSHFEDAEDNLIEVDFLSEENAI